jgi:DNA-binding transcriptional LysR family regulator
MAYSENSRHRVGVVHNTDPMDVSQLRYFLAVADERHFGRAAERLHLTISPVSRAVKHLERELGTDLFVRHHHHVELTTAGRHLARHATDLLQDFDRLRRELSRDYGRAPIRLGATHLAPPEVLQRVLNCVEPDGGDSPLQVSFAVSSVLQAEVERRNLDVALVSLPVVGSLKVLPLSGFPLFLAMRSDDPLSAAQKLRIGQLADRDVVMMGSVANPIAAARLKRQLTTRGMRRLCQTDDSDVAKVAAHIGCSGALALTFSPELGGFSRIYDHPGFAVVPLADSPIQYFGLIWRECAEPEPKMDAALAAIRAALPLGERVCHMAVGRPKR